MLWNSNENWLTKVELSNPCAEAQPSINSLRLLKPGERLVINAIRKEANDQDALLNLSSHDHLWMENEIKSVANITGTDVSEFLELASKLKLTAEVELYDFEDANRALIDLKSKSVHGAKVLVMDKSIVDRR